MTSLRSSIASHVLAFLADESRLKSGMPLPVPAIFEAAGLTSPRPAQGSPAAYGSGDAEGGR